MPNQPKPKKINKKTVVEKPVVKTDLKPVQKVKVAQVQTREINVEGKVLGRIATEIATILRGKDKPSFQPNLVCGDKVKVINASKIVVTGNKLEQKTYYHHTGYLGHLKSKTLKDIMAKNPSDALRRAVYGMLPDNKLRDKMMKNLEISN